MSEMNLDVILRMKIKGSYTKQSMYKFCTKFLRCAEENDIWFDPNDNNGFSFSLFEDRLYLDYYFLDGHLEYNINQDITGQMVVLVANKMESEFGSNYYGIDMLVEDIKFKVLYYYNGGCAGACEVE